MLITIGYVSQILLGFFIMMAGLGKLPKKYQVEIDKLGFLSRKLRIVNFPTSNRRSDAVNNT